MTEHSPNAECSTPADSARPARTFPPAHPLLAPALALIVGIWLSEHTGVLGAGARAVLAIATLVLLVAAPWAAIAVQRRASARRRPHATARAPDHAPAELLRLTLVFVAFATGFVRHQLSVALPPDHIAHREGDERVLVRLAGEVATPPVVRTPERRNPYLPVDPSPRTSFILAARESRHDEHPVRTTGFVRVRIDEPVAALELGDRVVVTGWLTPPRGPRNPGEADWARRDRLQHVYGSVVAESAALVEREPVAPAWIWRALTAIRSRARSALFEVAVRGAPDETTSLLDALLLGQRSAVSRTLDDAFVRTGSVHILSVSGSHLGVVAVATLFFARSVLRRGRRTAALATALVIVLYAALAEPNPPILRSAVMGLLACAAAWVGRLFATRNWLGAAAIAILLYNPLELFQVGFQLSFVQVFALVAVVPPIFRWANRLPADPTPASRWPDAHTLSALLRRRAREVASGAAIVAIVAWLASLPLVLLHFGLFTPFGAVQSLLLSPLFSIAIVLGFVTLVASAAAPLVGLASLAEALGAALATFMGWLIAAVEWLASMPHTLVETPPPPEWLVLVSYVCAGVVLWRIERQRAANHAAVMENAPRPPMHRAARVGFLVAGVALGGAWLFWLAAPLLPRADRVTLHVLAVGSGSANVLVTPDRAAAVFDLGTLHNSDAAALARAVLLRERVGRVALLAVSHDDIDHFSGVPALVERVPVERLITNAHFAHAAESEPAARGLLRRLRARGLELSPVSPADPPLLLDRAAALGASSGARAGARSSGFGESNVAAGADAVLVRVLWPPATSMEPLTGNDSSLVLQLEARGRRMLLPGDIEKAALSELAARHERGEIDLRSDVLVAPHHGSISGSATAAFYAAVAPRVVIISDRQARPRLDELVRKMLGPDVRMLNTSEIGAVQVHVARGGELVIETPFARTGFTQEFSVPPPADDVGE